MLLQECYKYTHYLSIYIVEYIYYNPTNKIERSKLSYKIQTVMLCK